MFWSVRRLRKTENYLHVVEEYFRCILLSQKTFEQFEIFRWHFHVLLSLLQAQLTPYVKTSPRRMKGKLVSNFFIHFSIQDFSNSRKDQILNWQNFKLDICTCTPQTGVENIKMFYNKPILNIIVCTLLKVHT